ncbi:MAG: hypothetical protein Q8Q28_06320 [Pseudomonadota bacterium]|nr:hypothetical protein [Pseudomonadota bacterium]
MRCMKGIAASLLIAACCPTMAAGRGLEMSAGLDYSTGRYGAELPTDIWYFPLTARYEAASWNLQLTLPYVQMTGPGNVLGANDGLAGSAGAARRRSASGQGDAVAAVSRNLYGSVDGRLLLDITGRIKFGTADASQGLGTGKNDFSLQADLLTGNRNWTLFGSAGHRRMGDTADTNFRDPWFASLGAAHNLNGRTQLGAVYETRQRVITDGARLSEVMVFASYKLAATHTLQTYVVKGFADGSPDWGIGFTLSTTVGKP